jgi:hypothetical protein
MVIIALLAPSAARAAATREDRAFAHAFARYDARAGQIVADPALLAALRARQQGGNRISVDKFLRGDQVLQAVQT